MKSHEVLKDAFAKSSPKAISAELGVSLSLVYKWAQDQSDTGSGSRNPLDRIIEIYEETKHEQIIEWLCEQTGGYYVRNPKSNCEDGFQVLPATHEIVSQFSQLLARISEAALDNSITSDEAAEIRLVWDKLKGYAEGFVNCCEEGDFELMQKEEEQGKKPDEPRKRLY